MAQGPILIFDKSALQMLTLDEAFWLDNFYKCNITPLFFVETLADLEKELSAGKSPEEYVGAIAHKTPDMQPVANVHHRTLLFGELGGLGQVPMDGSGRPVVGHGKAVRQGDRLGMVFRPSPEEEALLRWENGSFLEVERNNAKAWRQELNDSNPQQTAMRLSRFVSRFVAAPRTFAACKEIADKMLSSWDQPIMLELGLALVDIPDPYAARIRERWIAVGQPPLRNFAPYFCHVCAIDLTFYLATAAGLVRDADRPSNKVDVAYLYYLPFCSIFTSNDRLHRNLAPLFVHSMQNFIPGDVMKADLAKINTHYLSLPEEIRLKGVFEFAGEPPDDVSFVITQMWDKYHPDWRRLRHDKNPQLSEAENKLLIEEINSWTDKGQPVEDGTGVTVDGCEVVTLTRRMLLRKGSWRRVSPEIEKSAFAK